MTSPDSDRELRLRRDAEARQSSGTAPPGGQWAVSADAMGMLYRLASSPDTASDALKLLHEMQVHQIELGLQQEQIETAACETAEALSYYKALYELAPVPYFVVDRSGVIVEANRAGGSLLGASCEHSIGLSLETFLKPESRPAARVLFNIPASDGPSGTGPVQFAPTGITARLAASVLPSGDIVMIVVSEVKGSAES